MKCLVSWSMVLVLVVAGCTVPSLEELENERGEVKVRINYTESFKTGCFVLRVADASNVDMEREEITQLGSKTSPLAVSIFRRPEWPEKVRLTVTAHELACDGYVVGQQSVELDRALPQRTQELTLVTPDADGDGYVAIGSGGRDCDDSSNQARPGGPVEVCDGLDNDCVGGIDNGLPRTEFYRDADGDGVGAGTAVQACVAPTGYMVRSGDCDDANPNASPDNRELCNNFDDNCDGLRDEGFNKSWYGDGDGDGYGDQNQMVESCASVSGYVQVSGTGFDCNDSRADVHPGAVERCNGLDDNCANGADESFLTGSQGLGEACTNNTCLGVYICNPNNDAQTVCNAPAPTLYYLDADGDMQGASGSAASLVCPGASPPANRVANATDCDDADSDTKMVGTEVCDGLDNNCDGQLDEGLSCGGAFRQVFDVALGGGGHSWRTVAVHPAGYPVWVAGLGGKLAVRNAANAPFVSHSFGDSPANTTNCGDWDWYAAWVRPSDGHVFLAGEGGHVAEHTGTACINQFDAPGSEHATGIVGFESGSVTALYVVNDGGRLFTWTPGSTPVERENTSYVYRGIHAVDPNLLLVAGANGSNQFITSYVGGVLNATSPQTLSTTTVSGSINAVWMSAANRAFAVGDGGAVWVWNGVTNWGLVTPPSVPVPNFTSVVMPPNSTMAYMVDRGTPGKLWRRTASGWARAPRLTPPGETQPVDPDVPLYDIAMTSVGDFWMVGDQGRVYHYPQP